MLPRDQSHEEALSDVQFERIMRMTDAEIEAEVRARGLDPAELAARMRERVAKSIEDIKRRAVNESSAQSE